MSGLSPGNVDNVVITGAGEKAHKGMSALMEDRGIVPQTLPELFKEFNFAIDVEGHDCTIYFEHDLADGQDRGRWIYAEQLNDRRVLMAFGDLPFSDETDLRITDCALLASDRNLQSAGRMSDTGEEVSLIERLSEAAFVSTVASMNPRSSYVTRYSVSNGQPAVPAGDPPDRPEPRQVNARAEKSGGLRFDETPDDLKGPDDTVIQENEAMLANMGEDTEERGE